MKRKTIGENPLDQLGDLKGRGRKKLPDVPDASAREVRAAILERGPKRSFWRRLINLFRL